MNSIMTRLTIKQLLKNKKRTLITIIAVIISTAMVTGVLTLMSSFQGSLYESTLKSEGNWHAVFSNVPESKLERITENNNVENFFVTQAAGFAKNPSEESTNPESNPFIKIQQYTAKALKEKPTTIGYLQKGRFPKNEHEIVISTASDTNYQNYPLNSEITLEIGDVTDKDLSDWQAKVQQPIKRTFTVVGVAYPTDSGEVNYDQYLTMVPDKSLSPSKPFSLYIKVKDTADFYPFTKRLKKGLAAKNVTLSYNNTVLSYLGLSERPNYYTFLYSVVGLIIGLIAIGSISVIYTSFNISVSERMQQFGLLASVGATPKQLRANVYFESLLIGLLSIPLGVISGLVGIFITLRITSKLLETAALNLAFIPNLSLLLLAVAILCLILFISVYLPAKSTSRVSPIQNILQQKTIRLNSKKLKTNILVKRLFGFEGELAVKNQKRNRSRYLASLISLAISITLFIAFSGFLEYSLKSEELYQGAGSTADLALYSNTITDETRSFLFNDLADSLAKNSSVTSYSVQSSFHIYSTFPKKAFTEFGKKYSDTSFDLYYLSDTELKELLKTLEISQLASPNPENLPVILLNPPTRIVDYDQAKFVEGTVLKEGALLNQSLTVKNLALKKSPKKSIEIVAELAKIPENSFLTAYYNPILITTKANFEEVAAALDISLENESRLVSFVKVASGTDKKVAKQLESLVGKDHSIEVFNNVANSQENENFSLVVMIFGYGFITLITLVGLANIINTTTTGIALRKREFATLKSVGMTPASFTKMLLFENLFLGIKALIIGILLGSLGSSLFYLSMGSIFSFTFSLPIKSILFCSLLFVLLLTLISLTATKSIRKAPISDALKDENH